MKNTDLIRHTQYSTELLRKVDDTARALLLILGEDDLLEALKEEADRDGGWSSDLTLVGLRALKMGLAWEGLEAA